MTRDEMIEKIAAELWRVQVISAGAPQSVVRGRTPEAFSESSDETRKLYLRQAAAVLDLCGPKPLIWGTTSNICAFCDEYDIFYEHSTWTIYKMGGLVSSHPTLEAAQAAAQAHADAAHWANTRMGDV